MHPKNTKKMQKTHRNSCWNCKNHTKKCQKGYIGINNILPGFSPYRLSPITNFHHIGDNRYYRDILELVPTLNKWCVRLWTVLQEGGYIPGSSLEAGSIGYGLWPVLVQTDSGAQDVMVKEHNLRINTCPQCREPITCISRIYVDEMPSPRRSRTSRYDEIVPAGKLASFNWWEVQHLHS